MDKIKKIQNCLATVSGDTTSEVMARLLTDDSVFSNDMYESLACKYVDGTNEFRKGIDAACTELLHLDFEEVTDAILKER